MKVTMGLSKLKKRAETKPARMDAAVVVALRKAGAIPFAKTNMTQLGDTWGGGNPAYGDTLNPWNTTTKTTGGSSCGEGCVIGAGASPFGLGSDVGGSVRIPAAFCGICEANSTAAYV
jgi:Asp-tRNA(Asn)/Glu-tRNA(Gln) amidotransferase A subunit family amidase